MWKEESVERLERYKKILKDSPLLAEAADEAKAHEALTRQASSAAGDLLSQNETVSNVTYYCLAPALCAYVGWILKEAAKAGVRRLYFLARDAYFMYETAKTLCGAFDLSVECRYLSCSRYSVRIPMYHLDIDEALGYICRGGIDVTMGKILNRTGLSEEEKEIVLADLNKSGAAVYEKDDPVPYAELENIKKALKGSASFIEYLTENSKKAMPLLEGYLVQEGLLDDVPMAFADSGWVGSMQKILNRAVDHIREKHPEKSAAAKPIEGYYWGLYELPEKIDPENYHCYYFSPGYNMRRKVYFSNCLFEAVFSAPHGMTMGYKEENGRYIPVYGDISKARKAFMLESKERFGNFTGCFVSKVNKRPGGYYTEDPALKQDQKTVYRLLRCFMGEPCRQEAEIFGRLHFSDDVLDYHNQELAAALSEEELAANHAFNKILSMFGIKKGFLKESAWYEASAVLGGRRVKRHLRGYAGYKRLLYLRKQRSWRKLYG